MQKRIDIAGIRLGILLAYALPALAQLQTLTYRPVDSIYSTQLDRLVMVNANPSQLHIYNPITLADTAVALQYAPTAVSLSMDGLYAAVGHDQWISWVDLRNASVVRTMSIGHTVRSLAVTADYIYSFPAVSGDPIRYVPIAGGASAASRFSSSGYTSAGLPPRSVVARNGTSLYPPYGDWIRLDVGAAGAVQPVPLSVDGCSPYFPLDSARVLNACGVVRGLTGSPSTDLEHHGWLGIEPLAAAGFSSGRNELAVVLLPGTYDDPFSNTEVRMFRADYRSATGRFRLPTFSAAGNAVRGQGRMVAWSADSSRLIVLEQADPSAALPNDFGVAVFNLQSDCAVTWSPSQGSIPATGGTGSVAVTTSGACLWQATTSAPWLVLVDSGLGADLTKLNYYAAPNPTAAPRSANIVIGNQTWMVTQASGSAPTQVTPLPFRPVAAEYSRQLDRLVMISASPNQLHVWDAGGRRETLAVDLPAPPIALSLSPDGQFAGVALDGAVFRIILANGAIDRRFDITGSMYGGGLVLGSASAWVLTPRETTAARSLGLSAPFSQTPSSMLANGSYGLLSEDGGSLLLAGTFLSRLNIASGAPTKLTVSAERACNRIWPSLDGLRLFTGCGSVVRLSDAPNQDLTFAGSLGSSLRGVAQIPSTGSLYALASPLNLSLSANIQRYRYDNLLYQEAFPLPQLSDASGVEDQAYGLFLFPSASATQLYAIVQKGRAEISTAYGLYSLPVVGAAPCTYSVSPRTISMGPASFSRYVNVTTHPACTWPAAVTPSSSWLAIDGLSIGGSGNMSVYAQENTSAGARTGTVSVAGQTVTVTQADNSGCWLRVPPEIVVPSNGGTVGLVVEGPPSCVFPVRIPPGPFYHETRARGTSLLSIRVDAANTTGSPQITDFSIGSSQVRLVQLADTGCTPMAFILSNRPLPAEGAASEIALSFSGKCPATWSLGYSPSWLSIFPASGSTVGTQRITYTAYPNFSGYILQGSLNFKGMLPVSVVQAPTTLAADPRFVGRVYFASLGRTATTAESDFQIANALNKGVSRTDFAHSFLSAPEFNAAARYVAGLYVGVLARDAEYAGWVFQRNALATGAVNQLQLMANFLNSAEFQLKFGTLSNTEFVRLMYRNILLREAAPAEVTFQTNALNIGTPRVNLASNFLNSAEFQQGTGSRLMAFLVYATLLGRDPSATELAQSVARLNAGTPVRTLINEIVEGYEFTDLVN